MYGSFPPAPDRERRGNGAMIAGLVLLGLSLLIVALVANQKNVSVLLEKKQPEWTYDWAGESVPVPRVHYNYRAGTSVSAHGEFENSAMDKARPMQLAATKRAAGLSTKRADRSLDQYFAAMAKAAAQKQVLPPSDFTARAANKDIAEYFATQASAIKKPHPTSQLHRVHSAKKHAEAPTIFGESSAKSAREMADYWKGQAAAAAAIQHTHTRAAAQREHKDKAPKYGMSTNSADADMDTYFAAEQARAAQKQKAAKPHKQEQAPRGRAPKFGMSARAAEADANAYFKKQQKIAQLSESSEVHAVEREGTEVHAGGEVECIGSICTDKVLDRPLWLKKGNLLPDNLVPAEKADCTEDPNCETSHSPFIDKSKKIQKLSAYGLGAESDNAIELGKAVGVDATQPTSVIKTNTPPDEKTINEVNDAITSQRLDRYTNGEGMPVEKVSLPERTSH